MDKKTLKIEYLRTASLQPYAHNARTHSKKQIRQIADSIERFGFTNPVLLSGTREIMAGHGRVAAAKLLKLEKVPTVRIDHLSDADRRAYILADNRIALNAGWDTEILALEFQSLSDLGVDLTTTGFSLAEVDLVLDDAVEADPKSSQNPDDNVPEVGEESVTRRGEVWKLGRHLLICGDARKPEDYAALLKGEVVDLIFCDPPLIAGLKATSAGSAATNIENSRWHLVKCQTPNILSS